MTQKDRLVIKRLCVLDDKLLQILSSPLDTAENLGKYYSELEPILPELEEMYQNNVHSEIKEDIQEIRELAEKLNQIIIEKASQLVNNARENLTSDSTLDTHILNLRQELGNLAYLIEPVFIY